MTFAIIVISGKGNKDLTNIITPVHGSILTEMLQKADYNDKEIKYLGNGFLEGFDLEYEGNWLWKDESANIPLKGIGTQEDLWSKMIKEVEARRFAGPFDKVPFQNFVQSPIGLVPKAGGGGADVPHFPPFLQIWAEEQLYK